MSETKEQIGKQVNKVAADLDALSRNLIEIQYQIADITIPTGNGLDSNDIDLIKAQMARYRKALMESINQGKENEKSLAELNTRLAELTGELFANTESIESFKQEITSIEQNVEDVTISLNAELLATQDNLNATLNQVRIVILRLISPSFK